jgi:hypothetical protein
MKVLIEMRDADIDSKELTDLLRDYLECWGDLHFTITLEEDLNGDNTSRSLR